MLFFSFVFFFLFLFWAFYIYSNSDFSRKCKTIKNNDVPNSSINEQHFVFDLICDGHFVPHCQMMKCMYFFPRGSHGSTAHLDHCNRCSQWCCACLYRFQCLSLSLLLSLLLSLPSSSSLFLSLSLSFSHSLSPQCHCFLDIWPDNSTSLHLFVYFWQFAVCVHSEVIILNEWREN